MQCSEQILCLMGPVWAGNAVLLNIVKLNALQREHSTVLQVLQAAENTCCSAWRLFAHHLYSSLHHSDRKSSHLQHPNTVPEQLWADAIQASVNVSAAVSDNNRQAVFANMLNIANFLSHFAKADWMPGAMCIEVVRMLVDKRLLLNETGNN